MNTCEPSVGIGGSGGLLKSTEGSINEATGRARTINARISVLRDKVFGSKPETSEKLAPGPRSDGSDAAIRESLDALHNEIGSIENLLTVFEDSL